MRKAIMTLFGSVLCGPQESTLVLWANCDRYEPERHRWDVKFDSTSQISSSRDTVDASEIRQTHQLRLVGYPIIYRVSYIPGGCLGFLNHQQYFHTKTISLPNSVGTQSTNQT